MNLREKKQVIFSYAMVNLGILKITFNCFLTYKAIQTTSTGFIGGFTIQIMYSDPHEHVDVNVLDTSDTFFNVNDLIKDKWKKMMIMKKYRILSHA